MTTERREIVAFGDSALLIRFAERIDAQINAAVHALASRVRADREIEHRPWHAPVPSYASLLAPYDPLRWTFDEALGALEELVSAAEREGAAEGTLQPAVTEQPLEIPVRYGGEDGPDLPQVAERTRLTAAEVIELHASVTYRVYVLGFAPGFAYLGTLPERLRLPRRDTPRPRVPPGSVAIAGEQTAVYPLSTPGGWHLLGRTDVQVWDPDREPPALFMPARSVRFVPVTR